MTFRYLTPGQLDAFNRSMLEGIPNESPLGAQILVRAMEMRIPRGHLVEAQGAVRRDMICRALGEARVVEVDRKTGREKTDELFLATK